MYLEEINIIGFKSFANKTVLTFPKPEAGSKGITAIVGPNGSGKSNTADAVRWVLGETSTKMLRGKSRDDVIFAGSGSKSRMNFAEVTLKINNSEHTGGIEFSELEITRRVFRDGESEFLLNKNKVRREDIHFLLAKAGFGQKTYTVIGQGMADAVLSASLQERKEFFDEAVGVKQYQIKRDQTLNKFKGTRENLTHTEMTIAELEPRVKYLSRQVKKLEQREEVEKELKETQKQYYHHLYVQLKEKITANETEKEKLEKEIKGLEGQIESNQATMNKLYTGNTRQEVFEKLQLEYNKLMQEKNNLLREEALVKAKKDLEFQKSGQTNLVWLSNKKEELAGKIHELSLQNQNNSREIAQKRTELSRNQEAQAQVLRRIETVKSDLQSIKDNNLGQFDEHQDLKEVYQMQEALLNSLMNANSLNQLEDLRNQAREVNSKFRLLLDKINLKKQVDGRDLTNLQNQLEQLLEEKNNLMMQASQLELAINNSNERLASAEAAGKEYQREIDKIESEINLTSAASGSAMAKTIDEQVAVIRAKVEILERDVKEVEEKIQKFNEAEEEKKEELIKLQRNIQQYQTHLNKLAQILNQVSIELAKHSTRQEDLELEVAAENLSLNEVIAAEALSGLVPEEVYGRIMNLKKQMELIGSIDQETIDEYHQIKERYDFLTSQVEDLKNAIISLEKVIEELDETIKKQFEESFVKINREFQKYFKILFRGGTAELVKVTIKDEKAEQAEADDEEEEKSESVAIVDKIAKRMEEKTKSNYAGIEIKAEPPGKKIKSISMLSGGERALTSIALICAIISNNNSPFVVLDEMDSALDESNAIRFAEIIGEISHHTQFIVITHTRATMNEAKVLYGVTMGDDGVSKLLSIELKDAEEMDVVRH